MRRNHDVAQNPEFQTTGAVLSGSPPPNRHKNTHMRRLSGKLFFLKKSAPETPDEPPYAKNEVKNDQNPTFCLIYRWNWRYGKHMFLVGPRSPSCWLAAEGTLLGYAPKLYFCLIYRWN